MPSDWGMSPRDVASWFETPVQTILVNPAVGTKWLDFDPMRIAAILAANTAGAALVSLVPLTGMAAAGMPLALNQQPLSLTLEQHGPIAQAAFYTESGTATYTAWTISARDWPPRRASPTARLEALIQALASQIRNLTQALDRWNPDEAPTSRVQRPGDQWRDTFGRR